MNDNNSPAAAWGQFVDVNKYEYHRKPETYRFSTPAICFNTKKKKAGSRIKRLFSNYWRKEIIPWFPHCS